MIRAGKERARRTRKVERQKPRWPTKDAHTVFRKVPSLKGEARARKGGE